FTQSIANIEPGKEIVIEISYVEVLESRDGEYSFQFPMTVAPRYIPGSPVAPSGALPEGLQRRHGVVLAGPGVITTFPTRNDAVAERIRRALHTAIAIRTPSDVWWKGVMPEVLHQFVMEYPQQMPACRCGPHVRCRCFHPRLPAVEPEMGIIYRDGTGHLGGRWFYMDIAQLDPAQSGSFSPNTNQVPDASRITPMPVHPDMRAGHDITVSVRIDTGGPALRDVKSHQHEIIRQGRFTGESQAMFVLAKGREIPNRDFVLSWRTSGDRIKESIFTHTGDYRNFAGGFFTLILQPPDRVEDEMVRPRELIFVLDNSGSMRSSEAQLGTGVSAIDAAKRVINRAIDTMRPNDRFNIISFNNTVDVLWAEPRENTAENRAAAQRYVDARQGGGGTEMANAVYRALEAPKSPRKIERPHIPRLYSPTELRDLPPDGRQVTVLAPLSAIEVHDAQIPYILRTVDGWEIALELRAQLPTVLQPEGVQIMMTGHWLVPTVRGRAVFMVGQIEMVHDHDDADLDDPMRIVLFVTDGLVGNDDAIIRAIRDNAKRTRVFTIGMSRSPNRHLLDEMAIAGRGAADYVLPDQDVEAIVDRFARRIATPVLTDIEMTFTGDVRLFDVVTPGLPQLENTPWLPDLYDMQPLVIHGRYELPKNVHDQGEAATMRGALTIRGRTGAGRYERTIDLQLPLHQPQHDVIARLWAREKVGEVSRTTAGVPNAHAQRDIIALGEAFQIMTQHTSFVAVEKMRITVGGRPMLVRVPIEFPKDMAWEGIFGPSGRDAADDVVVLGRRVERLREEVETLSFNEKIAAASERGIARPNTAPVRAPVGGASPRRGGEIATGNIIVRPEGIAPSSVASPPPPPPAPSAPVAHYVAPQGDMRTDASGQSPAGLREPTLRMTYTREAGHQGNMVIAAAQMKLGALMSVEDA
ncbi:MAG TPA: VWA domain-containing protein, partial [Phycisphaerales bacterium]|nr:VWA domain-containing protein [Phycisphaerales bacterium]